MSRQNDMMSEYLILGAAERERVCAIGEDESKVGRVLAEQMLLPIPDLAVSSRDLVRPERNFGLKGGIPTHIYEHLFLGVTGIDELQDMVC